MLPYCVRQEFPNSSGKVRNITCHLFVLLLCMCVCVCSVGSECCAVPCVWKRVCTVCCRRQGKGAHHTAAQQIPAPVNDCWCCWVLPRHPLLVLLTLFSVSLLISFSSHMHIAVFAATVHTLTRSHTHTCVSSTFSRRDCVVVCTCLRVCVRVRACVPIQTVMMIKGRTFVAAVLAIVGLVVITDLRTHFAGVQSAPAPAWSDSRARDALSRAGAGGAGKAG